MTTYRIKDWHRFQHFRDRKPPWIKLYRDLLDDPEWHELPPAASKALVMLWLIASEDAGKLPEIRKIAFRLRITAIQVERLLNDLSHWLIQDDNGVISERCHDDAPERETEGETETETERERDTPPPPKGDGVEKKAVDKKPRERNPVIDAMAECDGSLDEITRQGWGRVAKALKEIREATPDVTPEEIKRRTENYRKNMPPGSTLTSTALAKHWARCKDEQVKSAAQPRKSFAELEEERTAKIMREAREELEARKQKEGIGNAR